MKTYFFLNILAPYRVGLYNKLSEKLNGEVKFYFDSYSEKNREWNISKDSIKFKYEILNSPNFNIISRVSNNTKLFRTVYFPFKVLKICIAEKPDTVISLEMGWRTVFSIIYSKIYGKKIYLLSEVTTQTEKKTTFIKKKFRKLICSKIDGGIVHGKLSAEYLRNLGLPDYKITISPDSIDNNFFSEKLKKYDKLQLRKEFGINNDVFIFLFVGQFIHLKGLDLLPANMLWLRNIKKNEKFFIFLVGGSGEELLRIVGSYDADLFLPIEFKQREELIKYYIVSDCLIFPTRSDVWGMVVNEAIACKLPVIVSKYAGCAEDLIEDGVNGYVFDPLNEKSFQETLKKCINEKGKLSIFAEKANDKLQVYNHENAANKIVEFLNS